MNQNGFTLLDLSVGALLSAGGVLTLGFLVGNMTARAKHSFEINQVMQSASTAMELIGRVGRCASVCVKTTVPSSASCVAAGAPARLDQLECTVDILKTGNVIPFSNVLFRAVENPDCSTRLEIGRRSGMVADPFAIVSYESISAFKVCDADQIRNNQCGFGSPLLFTDSPRFFRFQLRSRGVQYSAAAPGSALGSLKLESSFFLRTDGFGSETVLQCDPFQST